MLWWYSAIACLPACLPGRNRQEAKASTDDPDQVQRNILVFETVCLTARQIWQYHHHWSKTIIVSRSTNCIYQVIVTCALRVRVVRINNEIAILASLKRNVCSGVLTNDMNVYKLYILCVLASAVDRHGPR